MATIVLVLFVYNLWALKSKCNSQNILFLIITNVLSTDFKWLAGWKHATAKGGSKCQSSTRVLQ